MTGPLPLHGLHLIDGRATRSAAPHFHAVDPRTGATLEPAFADATPEEIDTACHLAAECAPEFRDAGRDRRATLLESIATNLETLGDALLHRAAAETALPLSRLTNERGRTCAQLRRFAHVVRDGAWLDLRIDHGDPLRTPMPKPDVRSMNLPLGPVAVFGASNFPLAFSVAGGDTASALAAGCPVVCKAHPAHPGTSELVGRAIAGAVEACELPRGTFALLHGQSHRVGGSLVAQPAIRAVAFTGSFLGGKALVDAAARRAVPIPVFAEMGSINPIFVLPRRLARDATALAGQVAASVMLGVGQFCTSPGVVVMQRSSSLDAFLATLAKELGAAPEGTLLHAGIKSGYQRRLAELSAIDGVVALVPSAAVEGPCGARAALFAVDARTWLARPELRDEVFGPATLVVVCDDAAQMLELAHALPGQLSATILGDDGDRALLGALAPILAGRTGRLLFAGMPTGVEVNDAIVHGGPWPATTDARSTSVGTRAILRFLRPVAWQDCPADLLPAELRDGGVPGLPRLVDGSRR